RDVFRGRRVGEAGRRLTAHRHAAAGRADRADLFVQGRSVPDRAQGQAQTAPGPLAGSGRRPGAHLCPTGAAEAARTRRPHRGRPHARRLRPLGQRWRSARMSLYYRAEPVARVWGELLPLLEAHYHEVAHYQDIPLCPDRERYEAVEANGMLRLYTARDDAGALVGYAVFFVQTNAHYATSLQAVQDVLFVHPDYRG